MDHRLPAETIALLDIHRAFGIKWIFPIGMATHFLTLWNALLIALWKSPFKIPSSPLLKGSPKSLRQTWSKISLPSVGRWRGIERQASVYQQFEIVDELSSRWTDPTADLGVNAPDTPPSEFDDTSIFQTNP